MPNRPPLPASWVEKIFARMTVVYGHAFLSRWAGLDLAAVKRSWGEELAGFADHPHALSHGLEALPSDNPPTVLAFRDLCRPALRDERQSPPPALPAPQADLAKVAALVASVSRDVVTDPKAWAWRLKEREEFEGKNTPDPRHRMTAFQRDAWRNALRSELATAQEVVA